MTRRASSRLASSIAAAAWLALAGCDVAGPGEPCGSEMGSRSGCATGLMCFHGGEGAPICATKQEADEGCHAAPACEAEGRCHYDMAKDTCVPKTDADCEASRGCREVGKCSLVLRGCAVQKDADCKRSLLCEKEGRCRVKLTRASGSCVTF